MKALAYFALIPASIILYIVLATQFGVYQRYPIPHFLIMVVGLFFLALLLRQKFSIWRLLLNLGGWAIVLLFGWWTLSYSNYDSINSPVAVGEKSNVMELKFQDAKGMAVTLTELMGDSENVLFSFYRGHW